MKKYSENLHDEEANAEEIIASIWGRLQNYSRASSKNILITMEIAKLYLAKGINVIDHLHDIKRELEQFKHLEKELPEAEKKDISMQITEMLKRLSHLP